MDVRVERVKKRYACDNKTARGVINESDHARSCFNRYYFDIDWEAVNLYDLLINTESMTVEGAVKMIKEEIKRLDISGDKADVSRKLDELELQQRVLIGILFCIVLSFL